MFDSTINNHNKSIYFIKPNKYTIVLDLLKFYMKCHQLKYFHIDLCTINHIIKIITHTVVNIDFFSFIFTFTFKFYTEFHLRKLMDNIYYFQEKQP